MRLTHTVNTHVLENSNEFCYNKPKAKPTSLNLWSLQSKVGCLRTMYIVPLESISCFIPSTSSYNHSSFRFSRSNHISSSLTLQSSSPCVDLLFSTLNSKLTFSQIISTTNLPAHRNAFTDSMTVQWFFFYPFSF